VLLIGRKAYEKRLLVGQVLDEWFGFLKRERRRNTTRIARREGYS
jgi:hypothetical protein